MTFGAGPEAHSGLHPHRSGAERRGPLGFPLDNEGGGSNLAAQDMHMRTTLAFLLGALLATLICRPWSRVDSVPDVLTSGNAELESLSPSPPLAPVGSELDRPSPDGRVLIAASESESAPVEEDDGDAEPSPEHDSDFYFNLAGAEREQFFAEHRWEYIETRRNSILRHLERLEAQVDPYRRHQVGGSLANSNIALILDLQNRARAWEPGVPEVLDTGKDGWYSFMSSNWVYRVNKDEFPEIAYFHGKAPFELDPETGQEVYLPMNPEMLTLLHQRADTALSLYDLSAPQDGD